MPCSGLKVPSEPSSTTYIELCTALKDGCRKVEPLREALGVVHWVLYETKSNHHYTYDVIHTPIANQTVHCYETTDR